MNTGLIIEFMFARADGMWDTHAHQTDLQEYDREQAVQWAEKNLLGTDGYADVVNVQVHNVMNSVAEHTTNY